MYKRVSGPWLGVVFVFFSWVLAGCGGDDGGGGNEPVPCTPGNMSVPGMDGDPCPQAVGAAPACPGLGMCDANGVWGVNCACVARGATAGGSGGAAAPAAPVCGNGVKEGAEQCDGTAPTCETMGMGSGMTMCTSCRIVMMCTTGMGMGGAGGS
jgi:hypothetical protein